MANELFKFEVNGTMELARNLAFFGSPKTLKKLVGMSLAAGAKLPLSRARVNARALGLGYIGFKPRRNEGESHGQSRRYGRIPKSLKAGRVYVPKGSGGDMYRLNVVARGQRGRGVYRNKAPHAHLIEYGFSHKGSGQHIAGRPFIGPALDTTAPQVVQIVATRMSGLIDGLQFPSVTGKGP